MTKLTKMDQNGPNGDTDKTDNAPNYPSQSTAVKTPLFSVLTFWSLFDVLDTILDNFRELDTF